MTTNSKSCYGIFEKSHKSMCALIIINTETKCCYKSLSILRNITKILQLKDVFRMYF